LKIAHSSSAILTCYW